MYIIVKKYFRKLPQSELDNDDITKTYFERNSLPYLKDPDKRQSFENNLFDNIFQLQA